MMMSRSMISATALAVPITATLTNFSAGADSFDLSQTVTLQLLAEITDEVSYQPIRCERLLTYVRAVDADIAIPAAVAWLEAARLYLTAAANLRGISRENMEEAAIEFCKANEKADLFEFAVRFAEPEDGQELALDDTVTIGNIHFAASRIIYEDVACAEYADLAIIGRFRWGSGFDYVRARALDAFVAGFGSSLGLKHTTIDVIINEFCQANEEASLRTFFAEFDPEDHAQLLQ